MNNFLSFVNDYIVLYLYFSTGLFVLILLFALLDKVFISKASNLKVFGILKYIIFHWNFTTNVLFALFLLFSYFDDSKYLLYFIIVVTAIGLRLIVVYFSFVQIKSSVWNHDPKLFGLSDNFIDGSDKPQSHRIRWMLMLLFGFITVGDIYSVIELCSTHAFANYINIFNLGLNTIDLKLIKILRLYFVLLLEIFPIIGIGCVYFLVLTDRFSDFDDLTNISDWIDIATSIKKNNSDLIPLWCILTSILAGLVILLDLIFSRICLCHLCCSNRFCCGGVSSKEKHEKHMNEALELNDVSNTVNASTNENESRKAGLIKNEAKIDMIRHFGSNLTLSTSSQGFGICFELVCDDFTKSKAKKRKVLNQSNHIYRLFCNILNLKKKDVNLIYAIQTQDGILYGFTIKASNTESLTRVDMMKRICLASVTWNKPKNENNISDNGDATTDPDFERQQSQSQSQSLQAAPPTSGHSFSQSAEILFDDQDIEDGSVLSQLKNNLRLFFKPMICNIQIFYEIDSNGTFDTLNNDFIRISTSKQLSNNNKLSIHKNHIFKKRKFGRFGIIYINYNESLIKTNNRAKMSINIFISQFDYYQKMRNILTCCCCSCCKKSLSGREIQEDYISNKQALRISMSGQVQGASQSGESSQDGTSQQQQQRELVTTPSSQRQKSTTDNAKKSSNENTPTASRNGPRKFPLISPKSQAASESQMPKIAENDRESDKERENSKSKTKSKERQKRDTPTQSDNEYDTDDEETGNNNSKKRKIIKVGKNKRRIPNITIASGSGTGRATVSASVAVGLGGDITPVTSGPTSATNSNAGTRRNSIDKGQQSPHEQPEKTQEQGQDLRARGSSAVRGRGRGGHQRQFPGMAARGGRGQRGRGVRGRGRGRAGSAVAGVAVQMGGRGIRGRGRGGIRGRGGGVRGRGRGRGRGRNVFSADVQQMQIKFPNQDENGGIQSQSQSQSNSRTGSRATSRKANVQVQIGGLGSGLKGGHHSPTPSNATVISMGGHRLHHKAVSEFEAIDPDITAKYAREMIANQRKQNQKRQGQRNQNHNQNPNQNQTKPRQQQQQPPRQQQQKRQQQQSQKQQQQHQRSPRQQQSKPIPKPQLQRNPQARKHQ